MTEGRPPDHELDQIRAALRTVVRLNVRLRDEVETKVFHDNDLVIAYLDSVWIRGRWINQFLLNRGDRDVVKLRDYLPGWNLPKGAFQRRLDGYNRQMSTVVAHLLRNPDAERALEAKLVPDLVTAFRVVVDHLGPEHPLRKPLDSTVTAAEHDLAARDTD